MLKKTITQSRSISKSVALGDMVTAAVRWLTKNPDYGKPDRINVNSGVIWYNGQPLIRTDIIGIDRLQGEAWQGWANIGYGHVKADIAIETLLRSLPQGEYEIELPEGGPKSRILPTRFDDEPGAGNCRLTFAGIPPLHLP